MLTQEQARTIVTDLITKVNSRFKQELDGSNEDLLEPVIRQYRSRLARHLWRSLQKWSKWDKDGPVLMPDNTRLYYRKGKTEIVVQEFQPQLRLIRLRGSLCQRHNSQDQSNISDWNNVYHYSLALPYVVFLFKFTDGLFAEVRCVFCDRPLKSLDEKPLRPYLSNINTNLSVCLGMDFDRRQLIKDNLTQQCAFVLNHFWQTVYSEDWSGHFWASRGHFQKCDQRLATIEAWQDASVVNPLFVVEDVHWLEHTTDNFGNMIVGMLEEDQADIGLRQELYDELLQTFVLEVKKTIDLNIGTIGDKVLENAVEQLTADLLRSVN